MSNTRAAICVAILAGLGLGACNNQAARPGTESTGSAGIVEPTADAGAPLAGDAGVANPPESAAGSTMPADAALPTAATVEEAFTTESSMLVPAKLVAEAVDKGMPILFVDSRVVMDYELSHIPGAVNVPYFEAEKHIDELPKDKWLIAYCECPTAEAKQVADVLRNNGFTMVKIIEEGLQGWKELGRPMDAKPVTAVTPAPGLPTP